MNESKEGFIASQKKKRARERLWGLCRRAEERLDAQGGFIDEFEGCLIERLEQDFTDKLE